MKANKLNRALRENENFVEATCFFNMCSKSQKKLFDNRYWIIELFSLCFPIQKIGVFIWDDKKEKLYGPFTLIFDPEKSNSFCFIQSGKIVFSDTNKTLQGYEFAKKMSDSSTEFYLHFQKNKKDVTSYRVNGFDEEHLTVEKV